jgi:hypothetical protein
MVSNTAISNNNGCNNSRSYNQSRCNSAETLARTTADGLQNTAISNNTDAITAEARADAITAEF